MKFGDLEIEDTLGYLYLGRYIALALASSWVVIWMALLLWRELREPFIDMLRIIQYAWCVIRFGIAVCTILLFIWYKHTNIFYIKLIIGIIENFGYIYYITNLFTWYLLIYHIKTLQELRDGANFSDWKSKIFLVENRTKIILILLSIILPLFQGIILILLHYFSSIQEFLSKIFAIEDLLFVFWFITFQIVILQKFSNIMKDNLNYYFKNNWKRLLFLFRLSMIYFITWFILFLVSIIFNIDGGKLFGIKTPCYNEYIRIMFLFFYLFGNFMSFTYAFYNYKGVNFKYWIWDTFNGYKIPHHFKQSSIFIIKNRYYKHNSEDDDLLGTPDSFNPTISDLSSGKIDYEVNDNYMKNYKLNYLNNTRVNTNKW